MSGVHFQKVKSVKRKVCFSLALIRCTGDIDGLVGADCEFFSFF